MDNSIFPLLLPANFAVRRLNESHTLGCGFLLRCVSLRLFVAYWVISKLTVSSRLPDVSSTSTRHEPIS